MYTLGRPNLDIFSHFPWPKSNSKENEGQENSAVKKVGKNKRFLQNVTISN